jgi:AcrR family transcriptional regulator
MATTRKSRRTRTRRPGRPGVPGHTEAVREALVTAARNLFAQGDFKSVSVREIARAAGVNAAMVHYHFGDKHGLYRAVLEATIGPMMIQIQNVIAAPMADHTVGIQQLMSNMIRMAAREPWVTQLLVREVLAKEGPMRETFIREVAPRAGGRIPSLIKREIEQGRIRADLDPILGALSVMSLCMFPFIALPVATRTFDFKMNDALAERLAEHVVRLFDRGARVAAR